MYDFFIKLEMDGPGEREMCNGSGNRPCGRDGTRQGDAGGLGCFRLKDAGFFEGFATFG
jgi:hypothetical protein